MKSLNILDLGGMPFTQDRLLWMQNAVAEAIKNGLSISGKTNYVINGVRSTTISTNVLGNTAGILMLNGEVCQIDADTVGINVSTHPYRYVELETTYDPSGNVTNFNTSTAQLYQINKAVINGYSTVQAGKVAWSGFPYLEDILSDIIFSQGTAVSISGGLLELPAFDNIFPVDIAASDTLDEIIKLDPSLTVLWLQFVGSSPTDFVTINNGGGINTPEGESYIFKSGDWAMFIADGSTPQYNLVTKGRIAPIILTIGGGGGFAYGNGAVNKSTDGHVKLSGQVTLGTAIPATSNATIATLPAGYRPAFLKNFPSMSGVFISINTSGDIIVSNTNSFSIAEVYLDPVSFYID